MRKLHALLRQLPRLGRRDDGDGKTRGNNADRSSVLTFESGQTVRPQDIHDIGENLEGLRHGHGSQRMKLEFHRCDFEDGALVALEELIRRHGVANHKHTHGNNNNKHISGIQSLSLTTTKLSLGDVTPLVTRASSCLDTFSVDVRNHHVMTFIEKTSDSTAHRDEAQTVLLPQRTGKDVEATISSLHYGEPQMLETAFVRDIGELLRQCWLLSSLSLGPCTLNNRKLQLLSSALSESNLKRLLLSLKDGVTCPEARSILTNLLETLPPSLKRMELFLNDIPDLLSTSLSLSPEETPVQCFYEAVQRCPLDILELDNVGLNDETSFIQLIAAARGMQAPEAHLWVSDKRYLSSEKARKALTQSLPHMNNFYTLSLVDNATGPFSPTPASMSTTTANPYRVALNEEQQEWSRELMKAFHRNTGLRYVNIEIGSTFYPCDDPDWQRLFEIWKRNEWMALTRELLLEDDDDDEEERSDPDQNDTTKMMENQDSLSTTQQQQALWPQLVETLGRCPESGTDSIYTVVQAYLVQLGLGHGREQQQ